MNARAEAPLLRYLFDLAKDLLTMRLVLDQKGEEAVELAMTAGKQLEQLKADTRIIAHATMAVALRQGGMLRITPAEMRNAAERLKSCQMHRTIDAVTGDYILWVQARGD